MSIRFGTSRTLFTRAKFRRRAGACRANLRGRRTQAEVLHKSDAERPDSAALPARRVTGTGRRLLGRKGDPKLDRAAARVGHAQAKHRSHRRSKLLAAFARS